MISDTIDRLKCAEIEDLIRPIAHDYTTDEIYSAAIDNGANHDEANLICDNLIGDHP